MPNYYATFQTTVGTFVTDVKARILNSTDWANITGNVMKATTTRGAQMVIDLTDATITSNRLQLGIYRTHDGTTGVDKTVRYITYNTVTPATTTVLYVTLSVGKEHFYMEVQGPRPGETGANDGTWGSPRQHIGIWDLAPYHATDTVPCVVLTGHLTANVADHTYHAFVSRDQGNTTSWVRGILLTLRPAPMITTTEFMVSTPQPVAKGDGKYYLWPWVLVEGADGLRGRLSKAYFAGSTDRTARTPADEYIIQPGLRVTYGTEPYIGVMPQRAPVNAESMTPFGFSYRINGLAAQATGPGNGVVIAVPFGPSV